VLAAPAAPASALASRLQAAKLTANVAAIPM
jgi:hypothetical protein